MCMYGKKYICQNVFYYNPDKTRFIKLYDEIVHESLNVQL